MSMLTIRTLPFALLGIVIAVVGGAVERDSRLAHPAQGLGDRKSVV